METSELLLSGNSRLDAQLKFTAEIDKMTSIMRRTLLLDTSRRENDAEHSWHIAVMALYFEEYAIEKPDVRHAAEMCVVHDLVEIYAGDTFAFDIEGNLDKEEREEKAAEKLFSILPSEQGRHIYELWKEFDECSTVDSKYANCMDRLQPFIHNTMTCGHTWRVYEPRTRKWQLEKRMEVIKEFMPEVYKWMEMNINNAVKQGWLLE